MIVKKKPWLSSDLKKRTTSMLWALVILFPFGYILIKTSYTAFFIVFMGTCLFLEWALASQSSIKKNTPWKTTPLSFKVYFQIYHKSFIFGFLLLIVLTRAHSIPLPIGIEEKDKPFAVLVFAFFLFVSWFIFCLIPRILLGLPLLEKSDGFFSKMMDFFTPLKGLFPKNLSPKSDSKHIPLSEYSQTYEYKEKDKETEDPSHSSSLLLPSQNDPIPSALWNHLTKKLYLSVIFWQNTRKTLLFFCALVVCFQDKHFFIFLLPALVLLFLFFILEKKRVSWYIEKFSGEMTNVPRADDTTKERGIDLQGEREDCKSRKVNFEKEREATLKEAHQNGTTPSLENIWALKKYQDTQVFGYIFIFLGCWGLFVVLSYKGISCLISLILLACISDTAAYATGKWLKGRKLCPRISPGKTLSGALGGLLLTSFLGCLLDFHPHWGKESFFFTGPLPRKIFFSLIFALAAQTGDLLESWGKRRLKIKDTSSLFPGHGGLLDRTDSWLMVGFVAALFLCLCKP